MLPRLRLGSIAGYKISFDSSLLLAAPIAWLGLSFQTLTKFDPTAGLWPRLTTGFLVVAIFLFSLLVHELAHTKVAQRQGVTVSQIELAIIGGYTRSTNTPIQPRQQLEIALAGPISNLVLAILFGLSAYGASTRPGHWSIIYGGLVWLTSANLIYGLINLIPALLFDGGRCMAALLWRPGCDTEALRILIARPGLYLSTLLSVATVGSAITNPDPLADMILLMMIGIAGISGAHRELTAAMLRQRLATTSLAEVTQPFGNAINEDLTVQQFLATYGEDQSIRPVWNYNKETVGYLNPTAWPRLSQPAMSWTTVVETLIGADQVPRAWSSDSIEVALVQMRQQTIPMVVIHDPATTQPIGAATLSALKPLYERPASKEEHFIFDAILKREKIRQLKSFVTRQREISKTAK